MAAAFGGLLTVAGPALVVLMADLFVPGLAEGVDVATVLHLLLVAFHGSLVAAVVLTVTMLVRRLARR
jgi:hypothetical protein